MDWNDHALSCGTICTFEPRAGIFSDVFVVDFAKILKVGTPLNKFDWDQFTQLHQASLESIGLFLVVLNFEAQDTDKKA